MVFPRQEYWSGLLILSPGALPDPGITPKSPAWQVDSLPLSHQEAYTQTVLRQYILYFLATPKKIWLCEVMDMLISLTVINISIYVYIYSQNMKLYTLNIDNFYLSIMLQ